MESILTTEQRERVAAEIVSRTPAGATGPELVEATRNALDKLESLAASAALWELWRTGRCEVTWDSSRDGVVVHSTDWDDN